MSPEEDLFPEVEITEIPTFDDRFDQIHTLLKENADVHQEIRGVLLEIRQDQRLLRAAYQEHGKILGELVARMNGHFGEHS